MTQFIFYFQYAARNLWRSRRWSMFGIFSIAAGVATMVALRSLGLAIGDSLRDNARFINKGDLTMVVESEGFMSFAFNTPEDNHAFSDAQLQTIRDLAQYWSARLTEYTFQGGTQVTKLDAVSIGRPQFINAFYIDPATYPVTGEIRANDPAGVPLGQLFQGGNEIVISQNLAETERIAVGDSIRVSGTDALFVVRGIVPTESQAGLRQLFSTEVFSVVFGFVYFDRALAGSVIPVEGGVNRVSMVFPDGVTAQEIQNAQSELYGALPGDRYFVSINSLPDLLESIEFVSDIIGRFIVVMGLGAMLIGGVGIINTTLVMVRRRTEEVAALKTFGLKARQVALLFMAESLLLGVAGSIVGSIAGVLLSVLANRFGATLIQQPLVWRLYPEALLYGFALGIIVTVVFGVLPVLTAARVRPAIILRPNETHIVPIGYIQGMFAMYLVVLSMGLIAGQIVGNTMFGIIGVAVTIAILGLLALFLWLVVWLVGKLPSFGSVDLRLALRNLSTRRMRTATTLLALGAGMAALSGISFFAAGVSEVIRFTFSDTLGGNVLILPLLPSAVAQPLIDARVASLDGIEYRTQVRLYDGQLLSVDNASADIGISRHLNVMVRDTGAPVLPSVRVSEGRALIPEDRGRAVAVVSQTESFEYFDLQVGSIITMEVRDRGQVLGVMELEVVGIAPPPSVMNVQSMFDGDMMVPPGLFDDFAADFQINMIKASPEKLNEVLLGLSSLPLTFSMDISFVDNFLQVLINQFSAVPALVGLLSLGAATVIMANTVALATLERRRQIGILKAVGLKGNRVLRIMLLENTLVALLGSLLGLGVSVLGVVFMTAVGIGEVQLIPRDAIPVAILLILAAVGIGALATILSASVAIRERVLNVLRYE